MIKRILFNSVFALALFIAGYSPAFCANKIKWLPGIKHYVQIPVLYMTDRAYYKNGFLNQRKLENGSIYDMYCGSLEYIIENTKQKTLTEEQKKLGWHYVDKLPKNPLVLKPLSQSGKKYVYAQFGEKIIETAKEAGCNDVFLNVHGFNNPFAGSAKTAARLAYTVERPVVLYSWPSAARIALYDVDSTNNEWSQEHYNRLMDELVGVKKRSDLRFFLVAHSMGNRLAMRSASLLKGKNLFDQAFLVDPDLDAETFVHYVARYALGGVEEKEVMAKTDDAASVSSSPNVPENSHGRLRILFSHHDNALPIVQLLFSGGYTRLGQGADSMLASVFDPNTMPNIFQGASELFQPDGGKNDNGEENVEKKEDAEYLELVKAFQWIDYTVLDHGILGHTVPFDLIANLWSTGKAGTGLELITAENASVNRFTRFSSRVFRQSKHFGDVGRCEKVVFEKDVQGKLVPNIH
jgi:pimeloyl-ACP methyl ester carboxylesterase